MFVSVVDSSVRSELQDKNIDLKRAISKLEENLKEKKIRESSIIVEDKELLRRVNEENEIKERTLQLYKETLEKMEEDLFQKEVDRDNTHQANVQIVAELEELQVCLFASDS